MAGSAVAEQQSARGLEEWQTFSGTDLRAALGSFATGVTVITTLGDEHAHGMTANAFTSVSLDPPLVLVCVIKATTGSEAIARNGVFVVNTLCDNQEALSRYFASRDRPKGLDAFSEVAHRISPVTGCPILDGVAGYFDCRLAAEHEAGDHLIFIGEVVAIGVDRRSRPLLFHHGRYRFVREEKEDGG